MGCSKVESGQIASGNLWVELSGWFTTKELKVIIKEIQKAEKIKAKKEREHGNKK